MHIEVRTTAAENTEQAAKELCAGLLRDGKAPDFLSLHPSASYDIATLQAEVSALGAGALHGTTTCRGVMSAGGLYSSGPDFKGAGAFCIWDNDGDYGTAMRPLGDDPTAAAMEATRAALENAGRAGESPEIIWLSTAPATEERVLAGIKAVIGDNVPIIGASAADNEITGQWRVFDNAGIEKQGVVISALFPSNPVTFAYHNGHAPTEHSGKITRAKRRRLYEIDGEPAAEVYNRWTGGALLTEGADTGTFSFLEQSSLSPLGRYLDSVGDVPYYLLAHPAIAYDDGSIGVFSDVAEGETITLMTGSDDILTKRPKKVAQLAVNFSGFDMGPPKGALMVCCTGCMMAIRQNMETVAAGVSEALNGAPFLGIFSFGEQGMVMNGQNHHANLMISCIVFS